MKKICRFTSKKSHRIISKKRSAWSKLSNLSKRCKELRNNLKIWTDPLQFKKRIFWLTFANKFRIFSFKTKNTLRNCWTSRKNLKNWNSKSRWKIKCSLKYSKWLLLETGFSCKLKILNPVTSTWDPPVSKNWQSWKNNKRNWRKCWHAGRILAWTCSSF